MVNPVKSGSPHASSPCRRKYLFGPVNSRRLGLSLGVDLVPVKTCSYDCLYCEVGLTTNLTCERKEYVPTREIIEELDCFLQELVPHGNRIPPDIITITGSGEPTLHTGIGEIIAFIKNSTDIPVAVLTNSSKLSDPAVRLALLAADVVIPSLDSALPASFRKVNRPARECADPLEIIDGLRAFTEEFGGKILLEILLAEGINDSEEDIVALVEAVKCIRPERVQLNTVVRPPAEGWVRPLTADRLSEIAGRIQSCPVEIIADFSGSGNRRSADAGGQEIEKMLKRRPCTMSDICEALGLGPDEAGILIEELIESGRIRENIYDGRRYYQPENG
ncbi:MAG: radical SAM protein [Proteobacteria bacterium]|nr:radical SAM protein [Pseudomonadota bacterium]MBU1739465.1 radical SAM protein [Pseudomonadota bacterium]